VVILPLVPVRLPWPGRKIRVAALGDHPDEAADKR